MSCWEKRSSIRTIRSLLPCRRSFPPYATLTACTCTTAVPPRVRAAAPSAPIRHICWTAVADFAEKSGFLVQRWTAVPKNPAIGALLVQLALLQGLSCFPDTPYVLLKPPGCTLTYKEFLMATATVTPERRVIDLQVVGPGTTTHSARWQSQACGGFLPWCRWPRRSDGRWQPRPVPRTPAAVPEILP
jgi:hypothetical protein